MIQLRFHTNGQVVTLPPVGKSASPASMTDYDAKGTQILLIHDDGRILVSKEGLNIEMGVIRAIIPSPAMFHLERQLVPDKPYKRPFTTRLAKGELEFIYEPDYETKN